METATAIHRELEIFNTDQIASHIIVYLFDGLETKLSMDGKENKLNFEETVIEVKIVVVPL